MLQEQEHDAEQAYPDDDFAWHRFEVEGRTTLCGRIGVRRRHNVLVRKFPGFRCTIHRAGHACRRLSRMSRLCHMCVIAQSLKCSYSAEVGTTQEAPSPSTYTGRTPRPSAKVTTWIVMSS